jgi:very-long-chain enoyl-CoA reductase
VASISNATATATAAAARSDHSPSSSIEMWPPFLYPPPSSVYVAAMSAVSLVSLANAGLAELRGKHMAYSKFWHVVAAGAGGGADAKQRSGGGGGGALLSSRDGMLVAYVPALAAAAASFAVPGAVDGERAQILAAALAAHFLKRVLEVTNRQDLHALAFNFY